MRAALLALAFLATAAAADPIPDGARDVAAEDGLSGRDIYDRVIAHRLRSFSMRASLITGNGDGKEERSEFSMRWQDFRDAAGRPTRGIRSKAIIEFQEPFALRFAGYMVQVNEDRSSDQFAYVSALRRIIRVNMRGVTLYGTDFSFEDVIPQEAEDFLYRRESDETLAGRPVHVVELYPAPGAESEHSRIRVYVDPVRYIIVGAHYWNAAGVETKALEIPAVAVKQFGESWIPMRATMRNVESGSYTTLIVEDFQANPELDRDAWNLAKLESH